MTRTRKHRALQLARGCEVPRGLYVDLEQQRQHCAAQHTTIRRGRFVHRRSCVIFHDRTKVSVAIWLYGVMLVILKATQLGWRVNWFSVHTQTKRAANLSCGPSCGAITLACET
eukprot:3514610-Amphidinium_carterae.1